MNSDINRSELLDEDAGLEMLRISATSPIFNCDLIDSKEMIYQ
jgi:hypothetical protein